MGILGGMKWVRICMPAIISSKAHSYRNKFYINIDKLREIESHIAEDMSVEVYLVEVRDEQNRLVKRFKPFEKLQLETRYRRYRTRLILCLKLDAEKASRLNLEEGYKLVLIITKYDETPLIPSSVRAVYYKLPGILEHLEKAGVKLSLILEQSALNKALSYLWDAWFRLEENDVEGARTATRKTLEVLENFLNKYRIDVEKLEETKDFQDKMEKLISDIKSFLHYGGPHPGPTPRVTTELVFNLVLQILAYLAKCVEMGAVHQNEGGQVGQNRNQVEINPETTKPH